MPAQTLATWSAPTSFPSRDLVEDVRTSVGLDGTVAVTWWEQATNGLARVRVAVRPPGGAFTVMNVDSDSARGYRPAVAVGPQGQVVAVWSRTDGAGGSGIAASFRPPGGSFEAPRWLDTTSYNRLSSFAGFDGAGNATLVWYGDDRAHYATRTAAGAWAAAATIPASDPEVFSNGWSAVVADDGEATVAWTNSSGTFASTRSGTGAFPPAQLVTSDRSILFAPRLAADPQGGTTMLLLGSGSDTAQVTDRPSGGTFGPLRRAGLLGYDSVVARGGAGDATVACNCMPDPPDPELRGLLTTDRKGAAGAFRDPEVGIHGEFFADLTIMYDDTGRLHAAWRGLDPLTELKAIVSAVRGADGSWSMPHTVSATEGTPDAPSLDVAGPGRVALAWSRTGESEDLVEVSTWSPGPDPAPGPAPAAPAQPAPSNMSRTYQADAARTGALQGTGVTASLEPAWFWPVNYQNDYVVTDGSRVFALDRPDHQGPVSVIGLDLVTGSLLWRHELPMSAAGLGAPLAVAGGKVIVSASQVIQALDPETGSQEWSRPLSQWDSSPPVVVGDRVVAAASGWGSTVYVMDLADGHPIWSAYGSESAVTVAGDQVITVAQTGETVSRSLSDGSLLWSRNEGISGGSGHAYGAWDGAWLWTVGGAERGRVFDVAHHGVVRRFDAVGTALWRPLTYLSQEDRVVALDDRTLQERWSWDAGSQVSSVPSVIDGLVFVATADGRIVALDAATGAPRWTGDSHGNVPRFSGESVTGFAAASGRIVLPTQGGIRAFKAVPSSGPADTTPPQTTITVGPAAASATGAATFVFAADEPGSSLACRVDNGDWAACTSPMDVNGLADGEHDFAVRASDAAGNTDPTPATWSWTVSTEVNDPQVPDPGDSQPQPPADSPPLDSAPPPVIETSAAPLAAPPAGAPKSPGGKRPLQILAPRTLHARDFRAEIQLPSATGQWSMRLVEKRDGRTHTIASRQIGPSGAANMVVVVRLHATRRRTLVLRVAYRPSPRAAYVTASRTVTLAPADGAR